MMFGQYLSPMIGFLVLGGVSIRWPILGGAGHLLLAVFAAFFFTNSVAAQSLIVVPLVLLSALFFIGKFEQKRLAIAITVGCALITLICFGAEPVFRIANRFDDGYLGERRTVHRDFELVWAPLGPGWPTSGTTWDEAVMICRCLELDGKTLSDKPVDIWHLPTTAEIVAAQHRANEPCHGQYDPETQTASYQVSPDKETPIWNPHSQVIYMWTATETNHETALMIAYDGKIWPRPKASNWGYLGFRAVRKESYSEK